MQIKCFTRNGAAKSVEIDRFPDACPICHRSIEPKFLDIAYYATSPTFVELIFQCPSQKCQRFFISRYPYGIGGFALSRSVPYELFDVMWSSAISKISPAFVEIYDQAHKAEQMGLLQVCGPGYRKSLEFLIKDYVSTQHSTEEKQIKEMFLGACIEKYVSDANIKATAKRAVWLGNDETHYVKKWEDNDLQDLKKLISLVTHWIDAQSLTDELLKAMPDVKSQKASS